LITMNALLVSTSSIFVITAAVWALRRLTRWPLCPICLGVGGTWLWQLVWREMGYSVDTTVLAILLGGSTAGIAYLLEKRLPPGRSALWWKTLFIPTGFVLAYAMVLTNWTLAALALMTAVFLAVFFLRSTSTGAAPSQTVDELKRKMEQCC